MNKDCHCSGVGWRRALAKTYSDTEGIRNIYQTHAFYNDEGDVVPFREDYSFVFSTDYIFLP
jgi:hypothetical protein